MNGPTLDALQQLGDQGILGAFAVIFLVTIAALYYALQYANKRTLVSYQEQIENLYKEIEFQRNQNLHTDAQHTEVLMAMTNNMTKITEVLERMEIRLDRLPEETMRAAKLEEFDRSRKSEDA